MVSSPYLQNVGNFIDAPISIGKIFRMDDNRFIPAINFNDAFPDVDQGK